MESTKEEFTKQFKAEDFHTLTIELETCPIAGRPKLIAATINCKMDYWYNHICSLEKCVADLEKQLKDEKWVNRNNININSDDWIAQNQLQAITSEQMG